MTQDSMDIVDVDDGVENLVDLTVTSEQPQTQGATVQIVINNGSGDSYIALKDGDLTRRVVFHRNTLLEIASTITDRANAAPSAPVS